MKIILGEQFQLLLINSLTCLQDYEMIINCKVFHLILHLIYHQKPLNWNKIVESKMELKKIIASYIEDI